MRGALSLKRPVSEDEALIYVLYGEDDFTIGERLARIKRECNLGDMEGPNLLRIEGNRATLPEILAACNTVPFLAPRRMVIVEGLLARLAGEGERSGKRKKKTTPGGGEGSDAGGAFVEALRTIPMSTVLVMVEGKMEKTNPLLKALSPIAEVIEHSLPDIRGPELPEWVRSRARGYGSEISPQAVKLLIEFIGNDLRVLSQEIEKLSLYAAGRRVEESDVRLLVSCVREANIFVMVDAIVERRAAVASRLMHQLLSDGAPPSYLLHMIVRQFRFLVQIRELLTKGVPPASIGGAVGLTSQFALRKAVEQAQAYSMPRLVESYRKLLDADIAIKTGALDAEVALDLTVTDLCR
jgi:DNA polymerase-3 subunit delta